MIELTSPLTLGDYLTVATAHQSKTLTAKVIASGRMRSSYVTSPMLNALDEIMGNEPMATGIRGYSSGFKNFIRDRRAWTITFPNSLARRHRRNLLTRRCSQ